MPNHEIEKVHISLISSDSDELDLSDEDIGVIGPEKMRKEEESIDLSRITEGQEISIHEEMQVLHER